MWAHCPFVLKNIQNFVDLDVCKQLFVLNSYKSVINKIRNLKNQKSIIYIFFGSEVVPWCSGQLSHGAPVSCPMVPWSVVPWCPGQLYHGTVPRSVVPWCSGQLSHGAPCSCPMVPRSVVLWCPGQLYYGVPFTYLCFL